MRYAKHHKSIDGGRSISYYCLHLRIVLDKITHFVCTKTGEAIYSSPPSCIFSLVSLSDPKLELWGWERVREDGSGMPCFNKSTCKWKNVIEIWATCAISDSSSETRQKCKTKVKDNEVMKHGLPRMDPYIKAINTDSNFQHNEEFVSPHARLY